MRAATMGDGGTRGADATPDVFTCTPAGPSDDCTMAMNLGTLTPGQMLSATGNIATAGGQAYVAVSMRWPCRSRRRSHGES